MRATSKTDVSVLGAERGDRVRFPHGPPGMGSSSACCRKGHPIVGKSAVIYGVDWCSFTDRLNDYFYYLSLSRSYFFLLFRFRLQPHVLETRSLAPAISNRSNRLWLCEKLFKSNRFPRVGRFSRTPLTRSLGCAHTHAAPN